MLLHLDTLVQDLLDLLKDEPELLAETVVQTLTTVIVSSGVCEPCLVVYVSLPFTYC